jgi:mRNA-degrading endonuclease RelE of RelBE toxin-antitoxin system
MPWRLEFSARARRELRALSPRDQAAIAAVLDHVPTGFGGLDVAKLAGAGNRWRLRVGQWRVILELDNATGVALVARVVARKDAYRG